jgi:hypothetical protein
MNRHGIQRLRIQRQRLIGLLRGQVGLVVLHGQIGQQFVRRRKLRINGQCLLRPAHCIVVEAVGTDPRQIQHGLRILGIALQRLIEKTGRIDIVEPLMQQFAPARAVQRAAIALGNRRAKFGIGGIVVREPPGTFGPQIRRSRTGERGEAFLRRRLLAMQALGQALAHLGRRRRGLGHARDQERSHQRGALRACHLSSSRWTLASASSIWLSCSR